MSDFDADYIIIGAGSAGSIIAEGLSRDGRYSVLVLEAGGKLYNPWISVPAGFGATYYHQRYNYMFNSQPEPTLNQRSIYVPRGRGLGGSGSINAMIYVRGAKADFEDWRANGNPSWGAADVIPYFERLEQRMPCAKTTATEAPKLPIISMKSQTHPLCDTFLQTAAALNYGTNHGFNGNTMRGAGIYDANINKGKRASSYQAFLKPALKRSNLRVITNVKISRLHIKNRSVTGVVAIVGQKNQTFCAKHEVILCGGAVSNPQLLELSGIGAKAHIENLGITSTVDLPGVGENLQDHYCASFYLRSKVATLNDTFGSWHGRINAALEYVMAKKGPLSLSINQAGGFFGNDDHRQSDSDRMDRPVVQLYFNPLSYKIPKNANAKVKPLPYSGFLLAANACRPSSTGSIHARSQDPHQAPVIRFNFLQTQHDQNQAVEAFDLMRTFTCSAPLQDIIIPSQDKHEQPRTDVKKLDYFRTNGSSIYHLCGTCKMGEDTRTCVVDENLRVHGINNLRIADASVFPNVTSGNINAPTMMLALKAVDQIRAATF